MYRDWQVTAQKKHLKNLLARDSRIAVVGRVESWLTESQPSNSRYPVSCTQVAVEDSMEGPDGIEFSWAYTSKALRFGAGVAIDLSRLRPYGHDNGKGLTASGPTSFAKLYSEFNEVLRRGGLFKNGATVVYLELTHPDFELFLNSNIGEWAKKAVYIDDNPRSKDYVLNHLDRLEKLLQAVRSGSVWLAKKRWYNPRTQKLQNRPIDYAKPHEGRVFSNVCMEILLPSKGTCTLSHINLGRCTIDGLTEAFTNGMEFLCQLHKATGAGRDNYYLPASIDRQVGLGVLGLANFLANHEISYRDFADALYDYMNGSYYTSDRTYTRKALDAAVAFYHAFQAAGKVAKKYKMVRAFTIAPTATCSYRYKDLHGYTTAPEISPPICHPVTKKSIRDSATFNPKEYQYPLNVETAQEVGWETYYKLCKAWQMLMESTGLAHSMSANIWNQCPVDNDWFVNWLESPLVTTYYRMMADQNYVDKSSVYTVAGDEESEETDREFFQPVGDEELPKTYWAKPVRESSSNEETTGFCPMNPTPGSDCSACGE